MRYISEVARRSMFIVGAALLAVGWVTPTVPARAAGATDPQLAARRVLASGHTLPEGMTLARSRIELEIPNPSESDPDRVRVKRRRMVTGSFIAGGDFVTFEVIRGERVRHEEGPKYEIDVCFRDSDGIPFLAQYGGHGAMNPTCDMVTAEFPDLEDAAASSTGVGTAAAVSTAQAALAALASLEFKRSLAPEYEALIAQAAVLESFVEVSEDDCSDPDTFCEPEPEGEMAGQARASYKWRHALHVYAGWISYLPTFAAEHGATRAYRIHQRWGTQQAWQRCNHGRCPGNFTMYRKCMMQSAYNRQQHVHAEACNTKFRLFSGTIGTSITSNSRLYGRGHNCNDDVVMQQYAVRYNQHYWGGYGSGWPCDDQSIMVQTPWCFW